MLFRSSTGRTTDATSEPNLAGAHAPAIAPAAAVSTTVAAAAVASAAMPPSQPAIEPTAGATLVVRRNPMPCWHGQQRQRLPPVSPGHVVAAEPGDRPPPVHALCSRHDQLAVQPERVRGVSCGWHRLPRP